MSDSLITLILIFGHKQVSLTEKWNEFWRENCLGERLVLRLPQTGAYKFTSSHTVRHGFNKRMYNSKSDVCRLYNENAAES